MTTKENKNSLEFITELIKLVKENNLSHLEVEQKTKQSETLTVKLSQNEERKVFKETIFPNIESNTQISSSGTEKSESMKTETTKDTKVSKDSEPENHPGILNSPMVGTVYLAPEPGASPFVKIGDTVKVGQTILIVEAMKTLNQIPAAKNGIIKRIFVEDGTPVEFGSPLVVIE